MSDGSLFHTGMVLGPEKRKFVTVNIRLIMKKFLSLLDLVAVIKDRTGW